MNTMNTLSRQFSAVCLCVFATCMAADAQQWSRFRGPAGSGVSDATTVPTTITADDYNWNVELPGSGHSSPVVWGEKVFLTGVDRERDGVRYVFAIDARDGTLLWKSEQAFATYDQHAFNSYASSTPAVDAERVYVTWTSEAGTSVLAFDHDGAEVWRREFGGFFARHGSSASPVVVGGTLVVCNDHERDGGFVAGLDRATGEELWRLPRENVKTAPYCTPTEFTPPGGATQVVLCSTAHGLTGVDPSTGKVLWNHDAEFTKRCVASPVVLGDIIYASAGQGSGGKESLAVRPGRDGSAEEIFRIDKRIPYVPTGVGYRGHFYLINDAGLLVCVAENGDVLYQERATGPTYSSPVCVNGFLYCISREGELAVVKAATTFQPVSTHQFPEAVDATPAVANGTLYVRTTNRLISIGGADH